MRSDARRNRERIVAAALEQFAASGPNASMDDIACAAGLGVGTLYRHFPDRDALAAQIAADVLVSTIGFARAAGANDASAWELLGELARHSAGLPVALTTTLGRGLPVPDRLVALMAERDEVLHGIVARGHRDGSIRADIAPADVLQLFSLVVCRPGARPDDPATTVVLDGLAPR